MKWKNDCLLTIIINVIAKEKNRKCFEHVRKQVKNDEYYLN